MVKLYRNFKKDSESLRKELTQLQYQTAFKFIRREARQAAGYAAPNTLFIPEAGVDQ